MDCILKEQIELRTITKLCTFQELEGVTLESESKKVSEGVGKYIGKKKLKHLESLEPEGAKRTKVLKSSVTGFRDFSAW